MNTALLIKELCAPYKKLSFVNFMHDITFSNNQISMIVADKRMIAYYKQHQIPTLCTDKSGRVLADGLYLNKTLEHSYKECTVLMPFLTKIGQQFSQNYGRNSVHLLRREHDCQHFYSLFFDLNEPDFLQWVINNGAFLTEYIAQYHQKAGDLILEAKFKEKRIKLPNTNEFMSSRHRKKLEDNESLLTLFHHELNLPIHFPKQQSRCLLLMVQGKSAKEIAKELSISFRTVEYYFDKTRKQLGCSSNKKLIALYGDQLVMF
ncbi:helix-turn-helix transcriptional regulator [Legionella sp. W05-934-2]|uniref:helix-turn-helix transcriptional regulator n=1 Tax=Legionella TaxID=445 RepID=UPI00346309A9